MIRVLVAADSVIVRAGLEALLTAREDTLEVLGSSADGALLSQALEDFSPDVVLLECIPQDEEPILEKLLALSAVSLPPPALVVLADDPEGAWTAEVLRSGVRGVVPRSATAEEIVSAVEAAAIGLVVLHPDVVDSLLSVLPSVGASFGQTRDTPTPMQALTPREIEVLGMLAEGLGNKTIARRLGISEHTVKFHVSSIFQKLNASSRTEAVTLGAKLGLIML